MGEGKRGTHAPAGTQPAGKSGTPAAPCAQVPDNYRQLRRLAAFLEDAVGFQLALVTCDTPIVRDEQLDRLHAELQGTPLWLTRLDLTETPQETELLQRLRRHLTGLKVPGGKRPAVMVVGLEATLDYNRLGPDAAAGLAILENANAQRDAFARHCPVPVALWLNPSATSVLAARAADLWHWRSGTFCFTGPAQSRQEMEHRLLEMPVAQSWSLPRKESLERIASLRDLLAESSASLEAGSNRGRQRRMALLHELGLAHLAVGDAERAIPVLGEGLGIATEIGDRRGEGAALGNLGWASAYMGHLDEAIGYHERHLVITRELGDRPDEGGALVRLGAAYYRLGNLEKAIDDYGHALQLYRTLVESEGRRELRNNLAGAYNNRGLAYNDQGDLPAAIDDFGHALELRRTLVESEGRRELRNDLAGVYNNRGLAYGDQGDLAGAIDDFEHALELRRTLVESEGRRELRNDLAMVYNNRGIVYRAQGALARAIDDYGHALELRRTLVESEGRRELVGDLESTLFNRAVARMDMEAWDDARADFDAGGGLLHAAVRGGRIHLTPSFMQTVAGRIRALERLGRPEVVGPWVDDLAERLPALGAQFAGNPLWQSQAVALAEAVSANQEILQQAGVDAERLLHALAPLVERPDEPDADS